MRYLLIREEEITGQMDTAYKPRVPDGRIILAENEAKGLDNFSAQFLSAEALKVLMEQAVPDTGGEEAPSEEQPSGNLPGEDEDVLEPEPVQETPEEPESEMTEEPEKEPVQEETITLIE